MDFNAGFDSLSPRSLEELLGDDYTTLNHGLVKAGRHRNKIFHGQLTAERLSRDELCSYIADIRCWCDALARATLAELHYDGFERNSFRKCPIHDFYKRLKVRLVDANSYKEFIMCNMERNHSPVNRGAAPNPPLA
jgi:hypothetical protein